MKQIFKNGYIRKPFSLLLAVVLMMGILIGCDGNSSSSSIKKDDAAISNTNSTSEPDAPDDSFDGPHAPVTITFSSGNENGTLYSVADATAALWSKEIGYIDAHNDSSYGSLNNLELICNGNAQVALAYADDSYSCLNGTGKFEGNNYTDLKIIAGLWFDLNQVVINKKSGITSLEDVLGRRFAVGMEGSTTYNDSKRHLAAVALTFDDFDCQYASLFEADSDLYSGKIDGIWVRGGPYLKSVDIAYYNGCELLNIDGSIIDTLSEDYPWYATCTIPANTYSGQYQDVQTSGVKTLLVCRGDLDDRTVYDLTRTFWMNIAPLAASQTENDNLDNLTVADAVKDIADLPLHPGAERYYKEVGVQ